MTADAVDINDQGRFTMSFTLNYAALPSGIPKSIADERSRTVLKETARASLQWHQPNQSKLYVTSRNAYQELRNLEKPSEEFLKELELGSIKLTPIQSKLLAGLEKKQKEGKD